jgi:hypothetical protein
VYLGEAWNGSRNCEPPLKCFSKDKYYSQCLNSCPGGWECSTSNGPPSPPVDQGNQNNLGSFSDCKFKFGMEWKGSSKDYSPVDYIAIWIGQLDSQTNFNPYWHGEMLQTAVSLKKLPVFYGYIIANMARFIKGLKDCDVGVPNLCQQGANFIREYRQQIIAKYKSYASEAAKIIGRNSELLWLIEPDFWQYYGDHEQQGGTLNGQYMRQLFDEIASAVKSELPNSKLSWDISAWLGEPEMQTWWSFFASSPHITFIHTSGGQSKAYLPNIKQNELRWSFMSSLTKKKIIADTGYGIGGGGTGHNYDYDNLNNLKDRIRDGVIAVTQADAKNDWKSTLNVLRPALPKLC